MIFEGNFWLTGGRDGARAFFDSIDAYKPDAIICANDYTAFGAREVLQSIGLRVPEDVILAGFDNEPDSRFTTPPLTTIEQPLDQMADCAVEILTGLMKGLDVPRRTVLPTRTIYRRSCGCHEGDMEVVSADRWQAEIADEVLSRRVARGSRKRS